MDFLGVNRWERAPFAVGKEPGYHRLRIEPHPGGGLTITALVWNTLANLREDEDPDPGAADRRK